MELIKDILKPVMLRRTKKEHCDVLEIPKKTLRVEEIELSIEELSYYERLF